MNLAGTTPHSKCIIYVRYYVGFKINYDNQCYTAEADQAKINFEPTVYKHYQHGTADLTLHQVLPQEPYVHELVQQYLYQE